MLAKVMSGALLGIDAYEVSVEVDIINRGLPIFTMVGLPDGAVKEGKERIRSALKNSGFDYPANRTTINLAPADIKKEGAAFDLPIALGILQATRQLKTSILKDYLVVGELALDGKLRPVKGVLPLTLLARRLKKKGILLPLENAREAGVVEDIDAYPLVSLAQAVSFLTGNIGIEPLKISLRDAFATGNVYEDDFTDTLGQEQAKRALEVAAAGGHNILMIGPPGAGKTMLARRLPTILPDMTLEEAIEITKIHSVSGLLDSREVLVTERPFRAPHHTISDAGMIGGGHMPRPGEISLAHNGVLFLDEFPEFRKNVLESLRQPLEDGKVTISRSVVSLTYPSSLMLVGASNMCDCGHLGDPRRECRCTPNQINRYRSKFSGPLLDRIDIHCEVSPVNFKELSEERKGDPSAVIRKRVNDARRIQTERYQGKRVFCNSRMNSKQIKKYCEVDSEGKKLLELAVNKLGLSARAYTRLLKVSRTIADLAAEEKIMPNHISEAIQYRTFDRSL